MPCLYPSSSTSQVYPAGAQGTTVADEARDVTFGTIDLLEHDLHVDQEFWDPSMLASTNWLSTIDLDGFDPVSSAPPIHDADDLNGLVGSIWPQSHASTTAETSPASTKATNHESHAQEASDDRYSSGTSGHYYLDGQPTRHPRTKRRRIHKPLPPLFREADHTFDLSQPGYSVRRMDDSFTISQSAYAQLEQAYERYCLCSSPTWKVFATTGLPTKNFFEELIRLCHDHFSPTLPFVHSSTLKEGIMTWTAIAAMSAIGSHYIEAENKHTFVTSMHEFVRRIVSHLSEEPEMLSTINRLEHAQILILHCVGASYSGDKRLSGQALSRKERLAEVYHIAVQRYNYILSEDEDNQPASTRDDDWERWRRKESAIRLAYSAWLVDCMWSYHFQLRPALRFRDGMLPLPCHEKTWNAATADAWSAARVQWSESNVSTPTLVKAMEELYIEKSLPPSRGEFARVLMIHGLFQRSWDVERYFADPLTQWEPNVQRQVSDKVLPSEPVWLPSIPSYAAWQNSACDALDILHWQANASIGKASGMEHPTVLHLHMARVVLLVPHEALVRLAHALSGVKLDGPFRQNASISGNPMEGPDATLLRKWAVNHQYKARLAAIHAGVVFWHVRRYSADAFYEAPAVALAVLTLWAFGTFAKTRPPRDDSNGPFRMQDATRAREEQISHESNGIPNEESTEGACDIILLDRPTDDELVQQFIRHGDKMQAHISGVGDLYNPSSPKAVLKQSCTLLDTANEYWGVAGSWKHLLQELSRANA